MARVIKSLARKLKKAGVDGYAHREHRSAKNRRPKQGKSSVLDYKRKKEELKMFGRYRKSRKGKM